MPAVAAVVLIGASILQIRKPISRFLSLSGPNAGDRADNRLRRSTRPRPPARASSCSPGDSHAERMGDGAFCGAPVVNGGSHGANTQLCTWLLGNLEFKARPSRAILIVGANDIFTKSRSMEPRNLAEKSARIDAIAKTLGEISPQLVMTPLPPIPRATAHS